MASARFNRGCDGPVAAASLASRIGFSKFRPRRNGNVPKQSEEVQTNPAVTKIFLQIAARANLL
jgi:hypothetical protein